MISVCLNLTSTFEGIMYNSLCKILEIPVTCTARDLRGCGVRHAEIAVNRGVHARPPFFIINYVKHSVS